MATDQGSGIDCDVVNLVVLEENQLRTIVIPCDFIDGSVSIRPSNLIAPKIRRGFGIAKKLKDFAVVVQFEEKIPKNYFPDS
jgi:hypothetical protein